MDYPIDSNQIRIFVTLSKILNIRRSSEELNLTPSAISHSLKCLETDLGCRLFDRNSRKMTLTQNGENFLPEATRILQIMDHARSKMSNSDRWQTGKIHVGASPTACLCILPAVIREFKECFPKVSIKVNALVSSNTEKHIQEGLVDMMIGVKPPENGSIEFVQVSQDEICFVIHPQHPWNKNKNAPIDQIQDQQIIINSSSSHTYKLVYNYYRKYDVSISPFIELANEEAIKGFVQLNMGIGILPYWMVSKEVMEGRLRVARLGEDPLLRTWGISYSKHKNISFPENLFLGITQTVCKNLMIRNNVLEEVS